MSDIGLLMAGALISGQVSPPKLPEQPLVESDNVVQQSKYSQEMKTVPPTQITPPEFIQPDTSFQTVQSALKQEHQNILEKGTGDWENEDKGEFAPPSPPPPLLTPGIFVILNPDHNTPNDPLLIWALRATFRF
jgi:hypothetical protein